MWTLTVGNPSCERSGKYPNCTDDAEEAGDVRPETELRSRQIKRQYRPECRERSEKSRLHEGS
ncbi:hypothetical protein D3C71_2201330 [compost metagenome]